MPRRNKRYRPRSSSYEPTSTKPRTTDDMARDLVRRGLATPLILLGDNRRASLQHHAQEVEAA